MLRKLRGMFAILLVTFAITLVVAGVTLWFSPEAMLAHYIDSYLLVLAIFILLFVVGGMVGSIGRRTQDHGDSYHGGDWYKGGSAGDGNSGSD